MNLILINCWADFGAISGSTWGIKIGSKGHHKLDKFWNPLPLADRTPNVAKKENKREWCKVPGCWNYIQEKKGRDTHALTFTKHANFK